MPADVVNLRRARKDKARAEKDAEAAANRAKHGRTKAERTAEEMRRAKIAAVLDGAKREPPKA